MSEPKKMYIGWWLIKIAWNQIKDSGLYRGNVKMIMFYEKSSFGWNSLNTYLNNTSLLCVKIDFDYHLSDEKKKFKKCDILS